MKLTGSFPPGTNGGGQYWVGSFTKARQWGPYLPSTCEFGSKKFKPPKMSHLDAISPTAAFAAGLAEFWAPRARGINTTHVKASNRLTDFETRENMRFSSTINLNGKWTKL